MLSNLWWRTIARRFGRKKSGCSDSLPHGWYESGRPILASKPSKMKVLIPTPLRPYTDKQSVVELQCGSVDEVLRELAARYPDLRKQLFADDGRLRKFVNVY